MHSWPWDELELVHDSAKAHAGVVSDSASLELGYIVDRFHDGNLVLNVETLLEYWGDPRYVLDRRRTRDEIILRIQEKPDSSD